MLQITAFHELLCTRKCWLIDGAIGTELERRGYETQLPFWTAYAIQEAPDLLRAIYRDYLSSGCNILTTNTFRISWYLFDKHNRPDEFIPLLRETCQLTREEIAPGSTVLLGGSLTTLEDCYRPDLVPDEHTLKAYHEKQLIAFRSCNIDFILAETINSILEATVILKLAKRLNLPIILSLITNGKGELLSGERLGDFLMLASEYAPTVLSLNCRPIGDLLHDGNILTRNYSGLAGIYPNAPGQPHSKIGWDASIGACEDMEDFADKVIKMGFKVVGGCCGSTPNMLAKMAKKLIDT